MREDAGPSRATVSDCGQRTVREIETIVQRCTTLERHVLRQQISDARRVVASVRGSGAEEALVRWNACLARGAYVRPVEWLTAWREEPLLVQSMLEGAELSAGAVAESGGLGNALRVRALLLLGPTA